MKRRTVAWLRQLLDEIAIGRQGWFLRLILRIANNWKSVVALYFGLTLTAATLFDIVEEKHTFWDGVWWAFITNLTIGYGDIYPYTVAGRVLGILLAHSIILLVIPMIIALITLRFLIDNDRFTHDEQEELKTQLSAATEQLGEVRAQLAAIMEHLQTSDPPTKS